MKRVLVIAYYFPPCNLTAAQRASAWGKYFSIFGYYPIVITRKWEGAINGPTDVVRPSSKEVSVTKNVDSEIHYLPYKPNIQEKFYLKGSFVSKLMSRIFTFIFGILQNSNYFNFYCYDFYKYAQQYLKSNSDVKTVIITANPFILFKYGYQLRKEFDIDWIADYRDMWMTDEFKYVDRQNILFKLIESLERKSEKKWLSNASHITTVSDHFSKVLSEFTEKKSMTIENGYDEDELKPFQKASKYEKFTLCYSGSLFENQNVDVFMEGFKLFIDSTEADVEIIFLGTAYKTSQKNRLEKKIKGYEKYFSITQRVERKEALSVQSKSHALLHFAYGGISGIPSSKFYEYIGLGVPIVMCPGDRNIIEETIEKYNVGHVCNTALELKNVLVGFWEIFKLDECNSKDVNNDSAKYFTRKHSTKKMCDLVSQIN